MCCDFCAALVAATQDDVGAALLAGACTHVPPHNPCRTQCVCWYVCVQLWCFSLFSNTLSSVPVLEDVSLSCCEL